MTAVPGRPTADGSTAGFVEVRTVLELCARLSDFTPALLAEVLNRLRQARERVLDSMPIAVVLSPRQPVIFVLGHFPSG
jgi:hypothetical protein